MKFFVPHSRNNGEATGVWQARKEFLEEKYGYFVSNRRVFRIAYAPCVEELICEVGREFDRTG